MIRRYLAELIGTFVIVFAPVALSATSGLPNGDSGLAAAAGISGLAVLAMIFALGPISAAHFNPAVTLGFAVAKRFPWRFVPAYWAAQLCGAVLAAGVAALFFGAGHGVHIPSEPLAMLRNLGTETVITFILMLVIIAVATDSRVSGATPGIAIGMAVVIGVMIGGPVTGGSMNPARSFGPAVFGSYEALTNLWLYILGPFLGACFAALAYELLRLEPQHAKGAPNELLQALKDIASG